MSKPLYHECFYESFDKRLRLFARDYGTHMGAAPEAKAVILMHGLTRNSADFEVLAAHLARRFRVIVPDQRGRGLSQWDSDPTQYQPLVYSQDMWALLAHLGLERVSLIGTSMGGLMSMIMGAMAPQRIRGIVLNDVGPELDPSGLERIAGYVGKGGPVTNWDEAAKACALVNQQAFPEFKHHDWLAFAKRTYVENAQGQPVANYDPMIAVSMQGQDKPTVPPNLWSLWAQLSQIPMVVVRGELSDLLSAETVRKMQKSHPNLKAITVRHRGHAPMLDEGEAITAIDAFMTVQESLS